MMTYFNENAGKSAGITASKLLVPAGYYAPTAKNIKKTGVLSFTNQKKHCIIQKHDLYGDVPKRP